MKEIQLDKQTFIRPFLLGICDQLHLDIALKFELVQNLMPFFQELLVIYRIVL